MRDLLLGGITHEALAMCISQKTALEDLVDITDMSQVSGVVKRVVDLQNELADIKALQGSDHDASPLAIKAMIKLIDMNIGPVETRLGEILDKFYDRLTNLATMLSREMEEKYEFSEILQVAATTPSQFMDLVQSQTALNFWKLWKISVSQDMVDLSKVAIQKDVWSKSADSWEAEVRNNVGFIAGSCTVIQALYKPLVKGTTREDLLRVADDALFTCKDHGMRCHARLLRESLRERAKCVPSPKISKLPK